jgi:hypothetical protein
MVRPRSLNEFDKVCQFPAQGVHRPRYYSQSGNLPNTKAVVYDEDVFRAQEIYHQLSEVGKRVGWEWLWKRIAAIRFHNSRVASGMVVVHQQTNA